MDKKLKKLYQQNTVFLDPPLPEDAVYNIHFEIGGVSESFNWSSWLPLREGQGGTQFCTCFSRLNCAETKNKKENNEELNLSDLDLGVISGTTQKGNNLNNPSEAFRTKGVVKEQDRPWKQEWLNDPNKHWNAIINSPVAPDAKRYKGGNHSWVYGKQAMINALSQSPLQIAVGVGDNWGSGIIKDPKNYFSFHAVMCYGIDENENYLIEDTYPPFEKVLDKDYNILQCKSFADLPENWKQQRDQYLENIQKIFGSNWQSAKIFKDLNLISKGIYGAVRIKGTYWVWLIGPGGRQVKDQADFISIFHTKYQNGIVGEVSPEQAKLLGIKIPGIGNWEVHLKDSCFIDLFRKITWKN